MAYGTGSDERIKTNIKTIQNALEKLYFYGVMNIMILELNQKKEE
jgi:hypothetical protein